MKCTTDMTVKGLMLIASCKTQHQIDVAEQWICRVATYIGRDAWRLLLYTLDKKVGDLIIRGRI